MKRSILILLLAFLLLTNACASAEEDTKIPLATLPISVSPLQTETIPMATASPSPTALPTLDGYDQQVDLHCETYVETTWGSGPGQWGDPVQLGGKYRHFPPPVFNEQGELYVSDYANHRLLKYDGYSPFPVQVIHLPDRYFSLPLGVPVVTLHNILVPYDSNKIGILTLDGQEVKDIQLPYEYYYSSPPPILTDSRGGLFINGERLAYFDVGWEEEEWNEVSSVPAPSEALITWDGFVGVAGPYDKGSTLPLYKIDPLSDFLNGSWVDRGLPRGPFLFSGADQEGWAYMYAVRGVARFSIPIQTRQIGILPSEIALQVRNLGVAPDGTLYLIVYDREDVTVQPKIVKCRFPRDRVNVFGTP